MLGTGVQEVKEMENVCMYTYRPFLSYCDPEKCKYVEYIKILGGYKLCTLEFHDLRHFR